MKRIAPKVCARWSGLAVLGALVATPVAAQHRHMPDTAPPRRSGLAGKAPPAAAAIVTTRHVEENGVAVDLVLAAARASTNPATVVEGEDAELWLTLRTAPSGAPLSGRTIGVWVDRRVGAEATAATACHDKVQAYVQGQVQYRPAVDLTSYFVLALNNGNTISVIDPFLGFGSSKLYTTVLLPSPGEDWALDDDARRLYVTMPLINAVAVVRTDDWKVETTLPVGQKPTRVLLAPDGRTVWVTDGAMGAASGGVTVIDAATRAVLARIETGVGEHALTFSGDGRSAYVTNTASGTVSVIDAQARTKVQDVQTGREPVALAWSSVAGAVYVAHRGDGALVSIDRDRLAVGSRLEARPGLVALGFDPSGRWGFAVNARNDSIYVVDATKGTVAHAFQFGKAPDQVSFTPNFAYVRSAGTVDIGLVSLGELAEHDTVVVQPFPAGEVPPNQFEGAGSAQAIASALAVDPHMTDAVYVPNPADQSIYYYHYMEGMPTPSGRLNNYGFEPKATLVVGRDLREGAAGIYSTTFKAPEAGPYDVVFLLDEPRVLRCFDFTVAVNPARVAAEPPHLRVQPLWGGAPIVPRDSVALRFRLLEAGSQEGRAGVADLMVLVSSPTGWNDRRRAASVGDGVYEVHTRLPAAGVYYVFIASQALGLRLQDQPPATVLVQEPQRR